MIIGHGMVAFRDPNGIRPLVIGKRTLEDGRTEYMVASESVALDTLGFDFIRDVAPGEAIYVNLQGQLFTRQCAQIRRVIPACLSMSILPVQIRFSTRSPSIAPGCGWGRSWARRSHVNGRIWIST